MYDLKSRVHLKGRRTVGELIKALQEFPENTELLFSGCFGGYIHVEKDTKTGHVDLISIDPEPLDEDYPDPDDEDEEDDDDD